MNLNLILSVSGCKGTEETLAEDLSQKDEDFSTLNNFVPDRQADYFGVKNS